MIYTQFQGNKLSQLGFGAMRLPTRDGAIDEELYGQMIHLAMKSGLNYFDTAWPYHDGLSEIVTARLLKAYPRDSYFLADKYPGHQISASYDPAAIFEEQLRKCQVDYFDFYLLHNVYESSMHVYLDPQWGIIDYFKEQKRLGRIRHLGFSSHGTVDNLREFLDLCGEDMEFCQIQLNYLDWTLQDAKAKVELLNERNIPIWVMEPVRGGLLCKLGDQDEAALRALRPEESIPAWGFRFLQDIPGVTMILSGMSAMAQLEDNLRTFQQENPLSDEERQLLLNIAEGLKDSIPCTGCRYCVSQCPMGLDIPMLLASYNEVRFAPVVNSVMRVQALPENKQPSACIGCGRCTKMCPQKIDIPGALKAFSAKLEAMPKWADICRQREEAAKALAQGGK